MLTINPHRSALVRESGLINVAIKKEKTRVEVKIDSKLMKCIGI